MSKTLTDAALRLTLTVVFALAGLTQLLGLGHWVQAFDLLGGGLVLRLVAGLLGLAAVTFYWWPGRRGYGAALMLALSVAAVIAHLTVLGISSAPPAVVLAILAGIEMRRHQADFRH